MQLEGEFSMKTVEQRQHKASLLALGHILSRLCEKSSAILQGLTLRLYQPGSESLAALKVINREIYGQLMAPQKVLTHFQTKCQRFVALPS